MKTSLCFATIIIALMFTGCCEQPDNSDEYDNIYFTESQYRSGDYLWYVCYGTCFEDSVEKLSFVFFEGGAMDDPPGQRRVVSRTVSHQQGEKTIIDKQEGWLIDGTYGTKMMQLPTDIQLYEVLDRKLVTSNERVTLAQLENFVESQPEEYTIRALLEYVK